MATSARGPIKVGSGYIEIFPKISREAVGKMRKTLERQMEAVGLSAGRGFSKAVGKGMAQMPKEAEKNGKKSREQLEKEAKKAEKAFRRIEAQITRHYGQEAAARFRQAADLEEKKRKLLRSSSAEVRAALRRTLREEEQAARTSARRWQQAERERIRLIRQREAEALRAERAQAAAQARAQRQMLAAQRAADQARIRSQLDANAQTVAGLRTQLQAHNNTLRQLTSSSTDHISRWQKSIHKSGIAMERVGTTAVEAGNLVMTKLVAPLGLVASALTTIGVKSADSFIMGQMGLMGSGVSAKDSAVALKSIRQYGVDTPYSIEDMQLYMTKYIRSVMSHDPDFKSKDPAKQAAAGRRAAIKSGDIVRMVGDNAARAGNMDPTMVSRGMYAIDMMLDTSRVSTRNLKQFAAAAGISIQEMALMMGFEDDPKKTASAKMLEKMANARTTGGVQSAELVDSLLKDWAGPQGSKGRAAEISASTITGRIQQMKEGAQLKLGELFAKENPKTGRVEYTGLGEAIMGKEVKGKDGKVTREGGLLQKASAIGQAAFPHAQEALQAFFETLSTFMDWIQDLLGFLDEHPALKDMVLGFAKIAAVTLPFLLAFGLLTKVVGKLAKTFSSVLGPVARGARGLFRGGRQVASGVQSRRNGGSFREGYRDRRTQLRGGDTRGVGTRLLDGLSGRNSQVTAIRDSVADLEEQIRQANERGADLRTQLRQVNQVPLSQLVNQLAGSGNNSVQGAAQQAGQAVNRTGTQARQLNTVRLTSVQSETSRVQAEVEKLSKSFRSAKGEVNKLNSARLGSLRSQQVETTTKRVEGLRSSTNKAADAAKGLNSKSLSGLRNQFKDTAKAADSSTRSTKKTSDAVNTLKAKSLRPLKDWFDRLTKAADAGYKTVGQGTGAGSLAGRVGLLNGRSLAGITGRVEKLGDALKDAAKEADKLDDSIRSIGSNTGGGGGGGKGKGKRARGGLIKRAAGGVVPGYQPWVDKVPALLTPGESILRPEVTSAIGEPTINAWNQAAIRGQISRHARGGVVGRMGLDDIKEMVGLLDIAPLGNVAVNTMGFDATSDPIGGRARSGMLNAGDGSARWVGSGSAVKLRGMYDWITEDVWTLLKRVPTGVGQVAGVLGGAVGPTLKDYFWDDVWKGQGNVVERGEAFMADVFSTKTLTSVLDDLLGGAWDSVSSIWDFGKSVVSDPMGTFKDSIGSIYEVVTGSYNNFIGMIDTVRDIKNAPKAYAGRVYDQFMTTAHDAMPNTKGLFDFSEGSKIRKNIPDVESGLGLGVPAPTGNAITRWIPVVKQALAALRLSAKKYVSLILHRIGVESGGNPNAVNNWDINARNGTPSKGLLQTIQSTFDAYAGPYRKLGIFNPLASVYAGVNYAMHRYGSRWTQVLAGNSGYWMGTNSASPGLRLVGERGPELVDFRGGERVFDAQDTAGMLGGKKYEIHIHEAKSEPTPRAVIRALQHAEALFSPL